MRTNIHRILCIVFLSLAVVSCKFSENIYINENGSGKVEFIFDGSDLMQMAGDEMKQGGEQAVDSTFYINDLLEERKDSIAALSPEEQARLYAMKDISVHMVMNPESGEFTFTMYKDFANVNDLQDMFASMNELKSLGGDNGAPGGLPVSSGGTQLKYSYTGKKFTRTVKIVNEELFEQKKDSLGEMAMMFGSSTYTLNYHFPKKVKKVSNANAVIGDDKKSVTIEYSFVDFMNDPESLNVEVEFEK